MNTLSRYMMALCLFTSLLGQPIQASQNNWNWTSTAWTIGKYAFGLAAAYIGYLGLQYLTKNYTKKAANQPTQPPSTTLTANPSHSRAPYTSLTFDEFVEKYLSDKVN